MAATQRTPGPWRVYPGDPASVYSQDGTVFIVQCGQDQYCSRDERTPTEDEAQANAKLIAAAPDLLTQLKGMLGVARFIINAADIDPETTKVVLRNRGETVAEVPVSLLLTNTEAAIAKAEGR